MERNVTCAAVIAALLVLGLPVSVPEMGGLWASAGLTDDDRFSEPAPIDTHDVSHVPHDRITIYGNADFLTQGWPGNGTSINPYAIEGLEIVSNYDCIHISQTSAYFVVRDCVLRCEGSSSGVGVYLSLLSHGAVTNCSVLNKGTAIWVSSSSDVSITNSTLFDSRLGISMSGASSCSVSRNTMHEMQESGMRMYEVSSTAIRFNTIADCSTQGIYMMSSPSCVLANNTISSCLGDGLLSDTCASCTIANNTFASNMESGIETYECDLCVVTNNVVTENHEYGMLLNRGDDCVVDANILIGNGDFGVYLTYARLCTFSGNVFQSDGLVVTGAVMADWMHTVSGNLVNGKNLGYFINASSTVLDGSTYGQIVAVNCSGLEIEDATIVDADIGIAFYLSDNCLVNATSITGCPIGVYLVTSSSCNITYSTFNLCGVVVTGPSLSNWKHSFMGTVVNGRPIGCFYEVSGLDIDAGVFGQVIVTNCSDLAVRDGTFNNSSQAIAVAFSSQCRIINNTLEDNRNGIHIRGSERCEFVNNTVLGSRSSGIIAYSSEDCRITNNTVTHGDYGIYLSACTNCSIDDSTVESNRYGVFPSSSSSLSVSNTHCAFNERGLYGYYLENSIISNSEFVNSTLDGVYLLWFENVNFTDCVFEFNGANGLCSHSSQTARIAGSTANRNGGDGISLWTTDYCHVLNNDAFENGNYGILLHHGSDYNVVYGNAMGANVAGNGYAYTSENAWDDGVSTGNWWSDYQGEAVYSIDGPGNNVDHYPTGPTNIIDHADMERHLDALGVYITWASFSLYPDSYVVYLDDDVLESSEWDGHSVTVDVATDVIGVYNYTLFVSDTLGASAVDTVIVTVYDDPPSIDSPYDRGYNFDVPEGAIVWHPSDVNPDSYVVYRNSVPIDSGSWDGGSISVPIEGLPVGTYNFTLFVNDTSGNHASDRVMVGVWDEVPWIDSPDDVTCELGTTGNTVIWNATDANPGSYCVYKNGTVYQLGVWSGEPLTIQIDGFTVGHYNLTAEVTDTGGNSNSDTIGVVVIPAGTGTTTTTTSTTTTPTTTTTTTIDGAMLLMVSALVGVAVLAVVAVALIRRRSH